MPSSHSIARGLGAVCAIAALALPASAAASPYEQINRDTGAFTSPSPWQPSAGTAVGDVGRYAGFQKSTFNGLDYTQTAFVRDIQTNTTIDYGGGVQRVYGLDRQEQRALILRTRSGQQQVAVVPIAGGTPIIVAQFATTLDAPNAVISGDGRKVVVSQRANGTTVYDLTGGTARVIRRFPALGWLAFPPRAIDDTATTIVAFDENTTGMVILRGASEQDLPVPGYEGGAAVDSTGTALAYSTYNALVLRNFATGSERRWSLPDDGSLSVLWLGDRGSKIALAPSYLSYGSGAQSFTPAPTGTGGTWARFGDRFAGSLGVGPNTTPISANGRFALVGGPGIAQPAISLADLTGAHIVGANEGLGASAYLRAGSFVSTCSEPATFSVSMISYPYAPAPAKAVVSVKVSGRVIAGGTITHAAPSNYGQPLPDEPGWKVEGTYIPQGTGPVQLTATVTDGSGRVLTGTWSEPEEYCAG